MYNNDKQNMPPNEVPVLCMTIHLKPYWNTKHCISHLNTIKAQSREMEHTLRTKTDIPAHFGNNLYVLCSMINTFSI